MKILFTSLFFLGLLQTYAQREERLALKSNAKTVVIELASLNQLLLHHSEYEDEFVLKYNNHISYKKPELYEKDGVVGIKVIEDTNYLPGSQQNKYRAGQPLYPNYVIEIPQDVYVKIVYKKGNFKTNNFVGNLELYLDHGVVDLINSKGSVIVHLYAGVVNCLLQDTSITIETRKGSIDAEINDEKLVATKTSLKGVYGSPLNKLSIKSINAKVKLRPLTEE